MIVLILLTKNLRFREINDYHPTDHSHPIDQKADQQETTGVGKENQLLPAQFPDSVCIKQICF